MKKTISSQIVLSLFLTMLILNACRKGEYSTPGQEMIKQVTAWLDQQRLVSSQTTVTKIQALKGDLDFNKLRTEELRGGEKILVVPANGHYAISTTIPGAVTKTTPVNSLVMILDKTGKIRKGNIVQYIPEDPGSTELPDNSFYKIYNFKDLDHDGRFRYFNLDKKALYEFSYKNGTMSTFSMAQPKPKGKTAATIGQDPIGVVCIDWYWVTIDNDTGEILDEEYLYTTCSGGGGGSGGGDAGPSADTTMAEATQRDWLVSKNSLAPWSIMSTESLIGVRNANETVGGHFTSIVHLHSWVVATNNWSWSEANTVTLLNNGASARSFISGVLTMVGGSDTFIGSTAHTWSFSQVFP